MNLQVKNHWTFAELRSGFETYRALSRQNSGRVSRAQELRYFLPWFLSLTPKRSPILDQRIWVVFRAIGFLDHVLRPGMRVFEYGAGGSTLFFLSKGCAVWSVDHSAQWFEAVQAEVAARSYSRWQGFVRNPDTESSAIESAGPCTYRSEFGEYVGRTFSAYVSAIDEFTDGFFDLILIDGRARDSCFFHAHPKVRPSGWLVLDNSERLRYQAIHKQMEAMAWKGHRFFGPGPYVRHEFWETTIWQKPGHRESCPDV